MLTDIPVKTEAMPELAISRALSVVRKVRKIMPTPTSKKTMTLGCARLFRKFFKVFIVDHYCFLIPDIKILDYYIKRLRNIATSKPLVSVSTFR
ncbi:MAG: hypothetical protein ABI288_09455 [Ginsengibacter sp.]